MPRDYDDDRPRKRSRPRDDEDDRPRKRSRPRDDDEDEPTRARRRPQEEDDYDDRPRRKKKKKKVKPQPNVVGIIALVIGIGAVLFSFIPCLGLWAVIPGGLGVVLGLIGWLMAHQSEGRYDRRMPIIGLSVSVVAVLFGLSWILIIKHWEKKIDKFDKEIEAEMAKAEAERKKELAKAASEVQAAGETGALRLTAAQFAREYEDNEENADRKYKGKVLEVTGIVDQVDFFQNTEVYSISVRGIKNGLVEVLLDCQFARTPDNHARLSMLKPGDQVTIRGKCTGHTTLVACVLVP
jgi:hypothetical protein